MKHTLVAVTVLSVLAGGWNAVASAQGPPPTAPPRTAVQIAALAPPPPAGQAAEAQPPAVHLALADAIDRALRASHRIGETRARKDAADAAVTGTTTADNPVVSALGGYTRTNHVDEFSIPSTPGSPAKVIYPDVPDNWRARLDLQWPVYTFGRFEAQERAARRDADAAGQDINTFIADVRLDATRAFWALVTADEFVRVVEEALALIEAHLRDVKNMRDAGLLAPNDVLSVEAQVSRQRVQLIEARNMRAVAEADLARVTGIGPGVSITADAVLEGPAPTLPRFEQLLADALAGRSERQALQARAEAIGEQGNAIAATLRPTIVVAAGFDYAKPNPKIFPRADEWNETWDVGFNLAWPLWDGGRAKAGVAQTAANRRALEQRLAEFDTVLGFEVRQRQLDLQAARESIRAATDEVAAAAEARRVVAERFKAGLVTNTEVLDAQQALLVARFDRTRALANARLAEARLDRALGR